MIKQPDKKNPRVACQQSHGAYKISTYPSIPHSIKSQLPTDTWQPLGVVVQRVFKEIRVNGGMYGK